MPQAHTGLRLHCRQHGKFNIRPDTGSKDTVEADKSQKDNHKNGSGSKKYVLSAIISHVVDQSTALLRAPSSPSTFIMQRQVSVHGMYLMTLLSAKWRVELRGARFYPGLAHLALLSLRQGLSTMRGLPTAIL